MDCFKNDIWDDEPHHTPAERWNIFLDIGKTLLGLVGLTEALVDIVLPFLHHMGYDGEAELGKKEKDHQERHEHPEEESEVGRKY